MTEDNQQNFHTSMFNVYSAKTMNTNLYLQTI